MKKRLIRIAILSIIALTVVGVSVYLQKPENSIDSVVAKNFGGAFELTDHTGKTVTDKDFDNQWRMIYFGFTYCPAICPTELQKMATTLKDLGKKGDIIKPVFISVDPERDTVDVMKGYIELFHPRLVGLTGTIEQVGVAKKAYKIYSAKVKDDTMTEYTVDHSSYIYLMNPEGSLVRIFTIEDTAKEMAAFIAARI